MDRRAFLTLSVAYSTTLAFGATEEFVPSALHTIKTPSLVGILLDKLNAVQN